MKVSDKQLEIDHRLANGAYSELAKTSRLISTTARLKNVKFYSISIFALIALVSLTQLFSEKNSKLVTNEVANEVSLPAVVSQDIYTLRSSAPSINPVSSILNVSKETENSVETSNKLYTYPGTEVYQISPEASVSVSRPTQATTGNNIQNNVTVSSPNGNSIMSVTSSNNGASNTLSNTSVHLNDETTNLTYRSEDE
jgi:hypothetical protein